jgi:hypothetical protein
MFRDRLRLDDLGFHRLPLRAEGAGARLRHQIDDVGGRQGWRHLAAAVRARRGALRDGDAETIRGTSPRARHRQQATDRWFCATPYENALE